MKEVLRTKLPQGRVVVTVQGEGQLSPHPTDPTMPFETRLLDEHDQLLAGPAWTTNGRGAAWVHEVMVSVARRRR